MMKQEHKDTILAALKEQKELIQAQSETIRQQSELIEKIMEGLVYSAETTRLMKIQELSRPQVDWNKIKPVNRWIN
jgi:hypothetical protein